MLFLIGTRETLKTLFHILANLRNNIFGANDGLLLSLILLLSTQLSKFLLSKHLLLLAHLVEDARLVCQFSL